MVLPVLLSFIRIDRWSRHFFLKIYLTFLLLFIGYRYNVGMDWNNYVFLVNNMRLHNFSSVFDYSEIASNAAIWLASRSKYGIVTLNLISGAIMCIGLYLFARATENPWMTLVVTIPYYVIVIMSATRQAMAIYIIFALYAYWDRTSLITKFVTILIASLFHTSAFICVVLIIPNVLALSTLKRLVTGGAMAVGSFYFMFKRESSIEQLDYYDQTYIEYANVVNSPGAITHVLMIFLPSLAYIIYRKKWISKYSDNNLIFRLCIVSIMLFPGVFFYSTAFDRLSLYFSAGALVVLSSMPRVLTNHPKSRTLFEMAMASFQLLILYVWLEYGNSASAWLPYRNILF